MTEPKSAINETIDEIVKREVFIRGANRPFGELTLEDARARADELRAVTGWGPTVRVAPVAHAWRELAMAMERTGSAHVGELEAQVVSELAQRLWIVLPGGPMMS
jgi:formylglycine-generating enzyme required for sulfatase activity